MSFIQSVLYQRFQLCKLETRLGWTWSTVEGMLQIQQSPTKCRESYMYECKNEIGCKDNPLPTSRFLGVAEDCCMLSTMPCSAFLYLQFLARCHSYILFLKCNPLKRQKFIFPFSIITQNRDTCIVNLNHVARESN